MMKRLSVLSIVIILVIPGRVYSGDWTENIKLKGDFRYRHEIINQEDEAEVRHRHRIRARVYITGRVSSRADVVIGLSSGSSDPVSSNQTLTDGFSSKDFLIDFAYFQLKPEAVPGLRIVGGKVKNPFYKPGKSELVWDSDIRQEGMSATYINRFSNITMQLNSSGVWIEERKQADDSYLAGGQVQMTYHLNDKKGEITAGVSYFSYGNARGYFPFYDNEDMCGNSFIEVDDDGETVMHYASDFELIEAYGAVSLNFGEVPVTFFGDYVTNTAVDSLDDGWLFGISAGKTKKPGNWSVRYNYRQVKKDAVVGIYADSDFRGGGTDAKGHEINLGYQLMDHTTLAVTYFNNRIDLEENETTDFERWQIDLKLKF